MSKRVPFAIGLLLLSPAAFPQMAAKLDPGSTSQVEQRQEILNRQAQQAAYTLERADHEALIHSMANLAKLRIKLAEAWQDMGVSPQSARLIADAYDPNLAANMHHPSLRGKSDQEVAAMLQSAIEQKRYSTANQLLIDYQRAKLRLGAEPAPQASWNKGGAN